MVTLVVKDSPGTGEYGSINAAAAASVADGDIISIEGTWGTGSGSDDTTSVTINYATTITTDADSKNPGYVPVSPTHYRHRESAGHAFTLNDNLTLTGLDVGSQATGVSDELFRVNADNVTLTATDMLGWFNARTDQQDVIYTNSKANTNAVFTNCAFWNIFRSVFDDYRGTGTINCDFNSCSGYAVGNTGTSGARSGYFGSDGISGNYPTVTVRSFNCAFHVSSGFIFSMNGVTGDTTVLYADNLITNGVSGDLQIGFSTVTEANNLYSYTWTAAAPGTGSYVAVNDITGGAMDLRLQDHADNDAQDSHTNTTGAGLSIPSTDVVGTTRPQNTNYDVGFFEVVLTSGDTVINATLATKTIAPFNAVVKADVDISITATLATKTYQNFNATVTLSTDTNIVATLATKTYQPFNASVSAFVDTNITATLATKTYQNFNASVSLSTAIQATLATKTYQAFNAVVSTNSDTVITATLATKTYQNFNASVKADIDLNISATLATKTYTPFNAVVSIGTAIQATLATKSLSTFNATVSLDIGGATNIVATLASKTYTGLPAVVFSGEVSIDAVRVLKQIKSFNAVVSHAPAVVYAIEDLNTTVIHALEDADEQQRMLIENFNRLKDFVVTPCYNSMYGDSDLSLNLTTSFLKLTNLAKAASIHKNCIANALTGTFNLSLAGVYKINVFAALDGTSGDTYEIGLFVNGINTGVFYSIDVHGSGGKGSGSAVLIENIADKNSFIDLRIRVTSGTRTITVAALDFSLERIDNLGV